MNNDRDNLLPEFEELIKKISTSIIKSTVMEELRKSTAEINHQNINYINSLNKMISSMDYSVTHNIKETQEIFSKYKKLIDSIEANVAKTLETSNQMQQTLLEYDSIEKNIINEVITRENRTNTRIGDMDTEMRRLFDLSENGQTAIGKKVDSEFTKFINIFNSKMNENRDYEKSLNNKQLNQAETNKNILVKQIIVLQKKQKAHRITDSILLVFIFGILFYFNLVPIILNLMK